MIARGLKKLIYGILFLCIFGLVVLLVYKQKTEVPPTCSDGIRNQNEQDVDCGGPCVSCEIKNLRSPYVSEGVHVFSLANGRIVLLGTIVNPNEDYIADRVPFIFVIRDKTGYEVGRVSGEETIFPLEKRYVFSADAPVKSREVGSVSLEIASSSVTWKKYFSTLKPNIQIVAPPTFSKDATFVYAKGAIRNINSFSARDVTIIGIFRNSYNEPVFVSQWKSSDLPGLETREFTILFPNEKEIVDQIDITKTSFFVQTR